nr:MAG TPA: hypothetical protein [Crassvirales sp.]
MGISTDQSSRDITLVTTSQGGRLVYWCIVV